MSIDDLIEAPHCAQLELAERTEEFRLLIGKDGTIYAADPSVRAIIDYPLETLIGSNIKDYLVPTDAERIHKLLQEPEGFRAQYLLQRPEPPGLLMEATAVPAPLRNGRAGYLTRFIGIEHHAQDTLTGLPQRNLLTHALRTTISEAHREQAYLGLAYIDLDGFKSVNDSRGHTAGDKILASYADCLKKSIRGRDYAIRMGGDEFLLIAAVNEPAEFEMIIGRIHNEWDARDENIGMSIGTYIEHVTTGSIEDTRITELITKVDTLMYAQKHPQDS